MDSLLTGIGHNGGPALDPLLASAGLVVPPWLIDSRSMPLHPALLLDIGLRDYQWHLLLKVAAAMRAGYRRILVVAPTGAGKTVIAAALMMSASTLGMNSEFIVHRKELIKQTSRSFAERGLEHGFITAQSAFGFNPQQVTLAGVQSLVKRLAHLFPPNLVILDEAHHAVAGTWEQVLSYYAGAYVLGLTATPQRLDGRGLGDQFDILIEGPTVAELMQRGFLARYRYFAPTIPDMDGVGLQGGGYNPTQAAAVVDRPALIGNMVEHYLDLCPGVQGLTFGQNRAHSRNLAAAFNAAGVKAMHVDGSMSQAERDYFDDAFRGGDITMGCNVKLFGEGYDVPNVKYIGLGAAWRSLVDYRQACGRAFRIGDDDTIATICDHAGNVFRDSLGFPDEDIEWSLNGTPKRKKSSDDADSITQCKKCYRAYESFRATCPGCGDTRPVSARAPMEQQEGKLGKLEREELQRRKTAKRKDEERACDSFEQMVSLARARRYDNPNGWSWRQCKYRRIAIPGNWRSL